MAEYPDKSTIIAAALYSLSRPSTPQPASVGGALPKPLQDIQKQPAQRALWTELTKVEQAPFKALTAFLSSYATGSEPTKMRRAQVAAAIEAQLKELPAITANPNDIAEMFLNIFVAV